MDFMGQFPAAFIPPLVLDVAYFGWFLQAPCCFSSSSPLARMPWRNSSKAKTVPCKELNQTLSCVLYLLNHNSDTDSYCISDVFHDCSNSLLPLPFLSHIWFIQNGYQVKMAPLYIIWVILIQCVKKPPLDLLHHLLLQTGLYLRICLGQLYLSHLVVTIKKTLCKSLNFIRSLVFLRNCSVYLIFIYVCSIKNYRSIFCYVSQFLLKGMD